MRTLAAIARWLNVSLDRIVGVNVAQPDQCVVHREGDSTPDIVAAHLRADKKIDTATAQALERMFRSIYEEFAGRRASAAPDQASASPGAEPILVDPGDAGTPSDSD